VPRGGGNVVVLQMYSAHTCMLLRFDLQARTVVAQLIEPLGVLFFPFLFFPFLSGKDLLKISGDFFAFTLNNY
jgi:hypothetical protein